MIRVSEDKIIYTEAPEHPDHYTNKLDQEYTKYAVLHDRAVKLLPCWKTWISAVTPHIQRSFLYRAQEGLMNRLPRFQ